MNDQLDPNLEVALFNLNKYGLKPKMDELERLVEMDLIESAEEDGWIISHKGFNYIHQYCRKSSNG